MRRGSPSRDSGEEGGEKVDVIPFVSESPRAAEPGETTFSKTAWDSGPCLAEPLYVGNGDRTAVYPVEKLNSVIPMDQWSGAGSADGDQAQSADDVTSGTPDPYAAAVARVNKTEPMLRVTVDQMVTQIKEEKEQTVLQSIEAPDGSRWHPKGGDRSALFVFSPRNRFRNYLQVMVMWYPWFDRIILILIALNCVFLMLGDPLCVGHNKDLCHPIPGRPCPRCEDMPEISHNGETHIVPIIDATMADKVCSRKILDEYGCTGFFCDGFKSLRRTHECDETLEKVGEQAEFIFAILFTVEMFCKIICQGFCMHKGSYLRDVWNWIDFVVVIFGWVGYIPGMTSGFTALKTVRVFRPLRTMSRIPGMRPLISAIFRSFAPLLDVLVLFCFIFTLFGILALQLLKGKMRGRCIFIEGPEEGLYAENRPDYDGPELICSDGPDWAIGGEIGGRGCTSMPVHGGDGTLYATECLNGTTVADTLHMYPKDLTKWRYGKPLNPNPGDYSGFVNFDTIYDALLTLFQCMTMEGWTDVMYHLEDGWSRWGSRIYFMLVIIVGSWFVVNLALAVISDSFESAQAEEKELLEQEAHDEQERLDCEADKKQEAQNMALAQAASAEGNGKQVWSNNSNGDTSNPAAGIDENADKNSTPAALSALREDIHDEQVRQFRTGETEDAPKIMDVVVGSGCWRLRAKIFKLVEHPLFGHTIMALIGINTVILAMDYHSQDTFEENWEYLRKNDGATVFHGGSGPNDPHCFADQVNGSAVFDFLPHKGCGELRDVDGKAVRPAAKSQGMFWFTVAMNYILSFAFLVEMVLKLYAYGFRRYCQSGFNIFDAVIVISSGVEIAISIATPGNFDWRTDGGSGVLSVFRAFRLFRVFKLAKSWKSLYRILLTLQQALASIAPLSIVLLIFIFIFALLGQEFFGGRFRPDCSNLDFYTHACEENPRSNFDRFWPNKFGYGSAVSIFQVLTGENWNDIFYNCRIEGGVWGVFYCIILVLMLVYFLLNLFVAIILSSFGGADEAEEEEEEADARAAAAAAMMDVEMAQETQQKLGMCGRIGAGCRACAGACASTAVAKAVTSVWAKVKDSSLFIFPRQSQIRKLCTYIAAHEKFDKLILVCIILSCGMLAIENPRWEHEDKAIVGVFKKIDLVFVTIFTLECVIKVIAWGFILGEDAYLTNGWNVLDFIVVLVSLITAFAGGGGGVGALKSLRAFRALRPLRVINRNPGMKLVVNCLLKSIPSMINVGLVCLLFYLIFAILGVVLFKGQFYMCAAPDKGKESKFATIEFPNEWNDMSKTYGGDWAVLNWEECRAKGGEWLRRDANFDNLFESLKALFEVSSLEGWLTVMDHGIDAVGPGLVGLPMADPAVTLYFILVCLFCNFFVLNLVIGVVIDNYNALKEKAEEGSAVLNEGQKEWVKTIKKLMLMKPKKRLRRPDNIFRQWVFKFVTWKWFDISIMVCIISNCIVMGLDWYNITESYANVLELLNKILTWIFIGEFVLKLFALGIKQYYSDSWNVFDCIIVGFSILGFIFEGTDMIQVLRALRIFRLVRLVRSAKGIRRQLQILMLSWPSLFNVGGLLFLVFCIYSVLGIQFFFNVKWRLWLNAHANFEDFGTAFITLFRICTGENWNGLMNDCLSGVCKTCYRDNDDDECDTQGCGSTVQSLLFFLSFYLLGSLILINLFIAVILDNDKAARQEEHKGLPESTFEQFSEAWSVFDPDASNVMPTERLSEFVQKLEPPLGPGRCTEMELKKFLATLDIKDHGGNVFFGEVSQAMAYRVAGADVPEEADETVVLMQKKLQREMSKAELPTAVSTVGETFAALTLQKYLRRRVSKRNAAKAKAEGGKLPDTDKAHLESPDNGGSETNHMPKAQTIEQPHISDSKPR